MISLQKVDNAIKFTFTDSQHYLYGDGAIEVPVNSLLLVEDKSDAVTFKKIDGDVFVSAPVAEFGMSKSEIEAFYKENMVGSTGGGGGGGVTSGEVETMIDAALLDYYDIDEVDAAISAATDDMATKTWVGNQGYITGVDLSNYATLQDVDEAVSGKADTSAVTADIAAAVSGKVDSSSLATVATSGDYDDLLNKPTIPTVPTDVSAFNNDAGYITENAISGKADTSAVTAINNVLTAHTADTTIHVTSSDKSTWSGKQDALVSGTNIKTINNQSLLGSGNITISGGSGSGTAAVEVTQAEYDALVSGGTVDPTVFYIITDAPAIETSGFVQTSAITSAVTSASTDSQIPTAKAVYDALGQGGGGKAIEAGRGIAITTGATADTVSFNLSISAGTGNNSLVIGSNKYDIQNRATAEGAVAINGSAYYTTYATGQNSLAQGNNTKAQGVASHAEGSGTYSIGYGSHAEGVSTSAYTEGSHVEGLNTIANNKFEHASGQYNNSVSASTTFGDSGNTLFSVGNGTSSARHNAFEIRQNGDIYISKDGSDIKLQDNLGGGAASSAITSGDTNAVAGGAVYDKFDEIEQVTAAALNALNDNFGGLKLVKLTQQEYDDLAVKNNNTLYVII